MQDNNMLKYFESKDVEYQKAALNKQLLNY